MRWIVTKRNYHGGEKAENPFPWVGIRWVVNQEGQSRGICECWTETQAQGICDLMNANSFRDPAEPSVDKSWYSGTFQPGAMRRQGCPRHKKGEERLKTEMLKSETRKTEAA